MNLLLLGGTLDARLLAQRLHAKGVPLIYSLAGLTRTPDLHCRIVQGGFEQYGGLTQYIKQNHISAVLDATHPYAANISAAAILAARGNKIPYWQWQRDEWKPGPSDSWVEFDSWDYLLARLSHYQSVFFTLGRAPDPVLQYCLSNPAMQFIIRSATTLSEATMQRLTTASHIHWLQARGPFTQAGEEALFRQYSVDALVCKNSGGNATQAKLLVAREKGVPVFMLKRPPMPLADQSFNDLNACERFIENVFSPSSQGLAQQPLLSCSGADDAV